MKIDPKHLHSFAKLWHKKSGEKLTREEAIQEFYKLIALVKMQTEIKLKEKD